jgi:branched-chain amino acid transport system ATP-binding protein
VRRGKAEPEQLLGQDVSVSFGGVAALRGVSVQVNRGEIVGLIGPNGSGKTTFVNVLNGFVPADAGRVLLGDSDVSRAAPDVRARAGLARTFQAVRMFARLSVAENVEVGALAAGLSRRDARRHVAAVLDSMGLASVASVQSQDLPYGHERRVAVARAVVGRPYFLLLDEPAAGLDERETSELEGALRQIRADVGCGMLLIDHDMTLISKFCERVVVLHSGAMLASGDAATVMRDASVIEAYIGEGYIERDA